MRLCRISEADDTLLEAIALQNIFDHPENTDIQAMAVDDQDNIYISDGQNKLSVLDRKGVKLFSVTVNTWISNLFQSRDGKVYITVYGSGVFSYDLETDTRVDLFDWLDADINHGDVP